MFPCQIWKKAVSRSHAPLHLHEAVYPCLHRQWLSPAFPLYDALPLILLEFQTPLYSFTKSNSRTRAKPRDIRHSAEILCPAMVLLSQIAQEQQRQGFLGEDV